MKKVRGYVFSRPFMGERVPQHVQNLVIRDYCERNRLLYLLSTAEYAMEGCHLILEHLLAELLTWMASPPTACFNCRKILRSASGFTRDCWICRKPCISRLKGSV